MLGLGLGQIGKDKGSPANGALLYAKHGAAGYNPPLVVDPVNEIYKIGGNPKTFSDVITHASTSLSTMVDSDGLLKWCPHNLLTKSQEFDHADWTKSEMTVTANAATAPDGTTTADKIIPSVVAGGHLIRQAISAVNGTITVWAKAGEYDWFMIWSNTGAYFDLTNGVVGTTGAGITASIASAGDGWYKCSISGDSTKITGFANIYVAEADNDFNFSGNASDGLYIWGAHLYRSDLGGMVDNAERGDSYVPTTTAAVYAPRIGHHIYNGSSWVNNGLLHESEARTNLLTYSEQFDNAIWAKLNASISADATTAPDGNTTADTLVEDSATNYHGIEINGGFSATSGQAYTFSVYAKNNGRILQLATNLGASTTLTNFDLSDGTTGTSTTSGASIEDMGGGLYRCSITETSNATGTKNCYIMNATTKTSAFAESYAGDGTSGIYLYGAQCEAGSTPSSYIPTTTATVTRAAETLTIPAANLPYSSTAMSMQMDGVMTYADEDIAVSAAGTASQIDPVYWYVNSATYIRWQFNTTSGGTGAWYLNQEAAGVEDGVAQSANSVSPGVNLAFNVAARHTSAAINAAIDGTALTENSTPTALPDTSATDMKIGHTFMGCIAKFRMFDADIADAGTVEASAPSTEPSLYLTFDGTEESYTVSDWRE